MTKILEKNKYLLNVYQVILEVDQCFAVGSQPWVDFINMFTCSFYACRS